MVEKLNKTELSIDGGDVLIILIYCFTYAELRRFLAEAVCQTTTKAEKQNIQGDELEIKNYIKDT